MARVLLLDDEQSVLKLTATHLLRGGHTTVPCRSATSAREQFEALNGGFEILVADVSLETGSGVEVAEELQRLFPALKIIFMSGYPQNGWNLRDAALLARLPSTSVRVLQKPFSSRELLLKVEELVGQSREPAHPEAETK